MTVYGIKNIYARRAVLLLSVPLALLFIVGAFTIQFIWMVWTGISDAAKDCWADLFPGNIVSDFVRCWRDKS